MIFTKIGNQFFSAKPEDKRESTTTTTMSVTTTLSASAKQSSLDRNSVLHLQLQCDQMNIFHYLAISNNENQPNDNVPNLQWRNFAKSGHTTVSLPHSVRGKNKSATFLFPKIMNCVKTFNDLPTYLPTYSTTSNYQLPS